jgi:hypothetical protein
MINKQLQPAIWEMSAITEKAENIGPGQGRRMLHKMRRKQVPRQEVAKKSAKARNPPLIDNSDGCNCWETATKN